VSGATSFAEDLLEVLAPDPALLGRAHDLLRVEDHLDHLVAVRAAFPVAAEVAVLV
jgi:hypothetical protein